ncbi:MAG: cytochrome d ubiquinol oxidase subunit II [Chitinophagaceae bacterium]
MTRGRGLALFLLILSIASGYLMTKASLVSKAGMSLFYKEYNFLKTWWKGALLILIALTAFYLLHSFIQKRYPSGQGKTFHRISCLLALTGLYFTYNDFSHTISHHLLGERFHIGVYLFWVGWIAITLFFLTNLKPAASNELRDQQVIAASKPVD